MGNGKLSGANQEDSIFWRCATVRKETNIYGVCWLFNQTTKSIFIS